MSLRLCMRAMGVDDVVRVVAAVLKRHRIPRANFAGHSFGTLVVAHMRKIFPEAVASVLLCDPVCPSFSAFLSKEKNRSFFPLKIFPEAVASVLLCDPVRAPFFFRSSFPPLLLSIVVSSSPSCLLSIFLSFSAVLCDLFSHSSSAVLWAVAPSHPPLASL